MNYPQVISRKLVEQINPVTGTRSPAIECVVWLAYENWHIIAIDSALLALTDENESDVFVEAAQSFERRLAA